MKELVELEVAIIQSGLPSHLIACLTHAVNLFEGDRAVEQFIVDMQKEAYLRTRNGTAAKLTKKLINR